FAGFLSAAAFDASTLAAPPPHDVARRTSAAETPASDANALIAAMVDGLPPNRRPARATVRPPPTRGNDPISTVSAPPARDGDGRGKRAEKLLPRPAIGRSDVRRRRPDERADASRRSEHRIESRALERDDVVSRRHPDVGDRELAGRHVGQELE